MSINRVFLCGRLGRDPEFSVTQSGAECSRLAVATSRKKGDKEYTTWHQVKVFGNQAAYCRDRLGKGALVTIEGEINNYEYTKDNVKHYGSEVFAYRVEAKPTKDAPQPAQTDSGFGDPGPAGGGFSSGMDPDDIPF
jgi:single-strand DNA-binding protein